MFFRAYRFGKPLSSWKYLLAAFSIMLSLLIRSLPNILKNAESLALQLGKKLLYAVGVSSSHSNPWLMCFAMHTFRNLWNPSILLLLCGLYGGECMENSLPSLETFSLKSWFLNFALLSMKIFTLPTNKLYM